MRRILQVVSIVCLILFLIPGYANDVKPERSLMSIKLGLPFSPWAHLEKERVKIENGEKIIVGVNRFTIENEKPVPSFKIDESIRQVQSLRIRELKERRNEKEAILCLENIRIAAVEGTNLMPPVIAAVEGFCTLGEIADVLRKIYGEY